MAFGDGKVSRHRDPVIVQAPLGDNYDSIEFTVATSVTNYDVKANESAAFSALPYYTTINIRSDKEITVRLNDTSNSVITVQVGRPMELDNLMKIKNIYISNGSGELASIKIIGVNKGA